MIGDTKGLVRFFISIFLATLLCFGSTQPIKAEDKRAPIKVGALLPFSGGVELYGAQAKLGIDLAVKEINASGGVLGRLLEIVYEDDHTRAEPAIAGAHKLIEKDEVLAVIGPITSQGLKAIIPTCESLKTPLFYATNYEGGVASRYMFAFSTVPNQELGPLLPYMQKNYGNSFYLLGVDRVWPHALFETAEPMIKKIDGQIVGTTYATGDETDFTPLINKVKDAKPKVLLFALKGDGMNFIPEAEKLGLLKDTTVAYLGMSEADLKFFKGKAQNMFVVVPFVATSDKPEVKAFVANARKIGGDDTVISNYVMTHYNAMMAIKAGLEKAGKVDKEALIDAMVGLTIQTPTGPLTIGKNHHSTMKVFLAKTKGADLVTVQELGDVAPEVAPEVGDK